MVSKYTKAFAKNVKFLMKDMSIRELARETGLRHATLSRYLKCEREVSVTYASTLADYFNESVDYLLGRSEY